MLRRLPNLARPSGLPDTLWPGVQLYVEAVFARAQAHKLAGARVTILVEQKVALTPITTEQDAYGTCDCILIAEYIDNTALDVIDFKFGAGVPVSPVENGQIALYALGWLVPNMLLHRFSEINLIIHQPRIRAELQVWRTSLEWLLEFGQKATTAASLALSLRDSVTALDHLVPGEKQCRFCRALHRCPAALKLAESAVLEDFPLDAPPKAAADLIKSKVLDVDLQQVAAHLGSAMDKIELIEAWCRAIRAATNRFLMASIKIPGWKLVTGRKGDRTWKDELTTEMHLTCALFPKEKMYTQPQLRSPAQIEAEAKKDSRYDDVWRQLQTNIKQADGKPSVAPESDDRPPYAPDVLGDFT